MYKEVKFTEISRELLEQLIKGAFLTVRNSDRVNTMTIAWGSLGFMWNKPAFTVMVRYSRYTYELINTAEEFTVSFPLNGQLKKELQVCGAKSGRNIDKFKECNLVLKDGEKVNTPVIDGCDLHVECKIVFKHPVTEENLAETTKQRAYSQGDYHVIFYGEIVKAYIKQ
jgi:flavin reductase (DIM6/NTAB) family NADH-FMN oxidoreductase RutF